MSGSAASRRFFVAVDASPSSLDALNETVRLRHADDYVKVVNLLEYGRDATEVADTPSRSLLERFELFLTPRLSKSRWSVEYQKLDEDTTIRRGIVEAVNSGGYDFLVAGYNHPRAPGERPSFLHSSVDPCVRRAHADIIIVKERLPEGIPLVFIVGADGSPTSRRAFEVAKYLSNGRGAVHVVHIVDSEIEAKLPHKYGSEAIEKEYSGDVSDNIVFANVPRTSSDSPLADSLIDYCERMSGTHLIVGVDGMTAVTEGREAFGSVSDRCAVLAKCPVVLVHPVHTSVAK